MSDRSDPSPSSSLHPRIAVVLLAAGAGRRMGGARNKVFLSIVDVPILRLSAACFAHDERVEEMIVVTRPDEREEIRRLLAPLHAAIGFVRYVDGGKERSDSVRNGVLATSNRVEIVLIHDGARPFVTRRLIDRVVEAAMRSGAAIPALPVVDTLKRGQGGMIVETVDRDGLFAAQTPQGFQRRSLLDVLTAPAPTHPLTDDASWFEGRSDVALVMGDPVNLKITRAEDLRLASALKPLFDSPLEEPA